MSVKQAAIKAANQLVAAALKKKRWKPDESKRWSRAFNALRRLSGT